MRSVRLALALLPLVGCEAVIGLNNLHPRDDAGEDSSIDDAAPDVTPDAADGSSVVNGCTTFTDDRGQSSPSVAGPSNSTPAQYTPSCVHIKAGQTVEFTGDFTDLPLEPFGGDGSNPINAVSSGSVATFSFSTPGVFGFNCAAHSTVMFGAVEVTSN